MSNLLEITKSCLAFIDEMYDKNILSDKDINDWGGYDDLKKTISNLSPIEEQTKPLFIETDKHKMDFEIVGHQEGKEEVIYLKRYKEEQTNLVAEGSNTDKAPKATLSSGSSNSVEQMQKIIDMLFELSWTVGKKNEAVSWSRFDEAIELRSKQREIELLVNPLYQEWVNKNNKESEFDKLDPKDKEIMRLREIIKKHNIEQNPETSVASKAEFSTVRPDNNSEKTMTSKDHSRLKEGEGKPLERIYVDELHGFQAKATSKTMAWQLIRNKCHELNLPVPTMDKIKLEEIEPKVKVSNTDEERPGNASDFINRAIGMLKEQHKDEWLTAGYNGIVALLGYAKEKINRMESENERLRNLLAEAEQHPNGFHYNAENSPTKKLAELNKNKGDKNV